MIGNDHIKLRWLNYIAQMIKKDQRYDIETELDKFFLDEISLADLNLIISNNGYRSLGDYKKDELAKDGV